MNTSFRITSAHGTTRFGNLTTAANYARESAIETNDNVCLEVIVCGAVVAAHIF